MSWRIVSITKPAKLSVRQYQLVIEQEENSVSVPLEDISALMIETHQAQLTAHLLSELAERGAAVFFCDGKHTPCGISLPFMQHSRFSETAWLQQECSIPFKKRAWQRLAKAKILNQADALEKLGHDGVPVLRALAGRVQSGDSSNAEAQAARVYWQNLFSGFSRESEDKRNSALNYGYAILRGAVARAISGSGLLPCFGLHHANKLNAFNLADDLLEPFRPFVDLRIAELAADSAFMTEELTPGQKAEITRVLTRNCLMGENCVSMLTACDQAADSLVSAMKAKEPALLILPQIPAKEPETDGTHG